MDAISSYLSVDISYGMTFPPAHLNSITLFDCIDVCFFGGGYFNYL